MNSFLYNRSASSVLFPDHTTYFRGFRLLWINYIGIGSWKYQSRRKNNNRRGNENIVINKIYIYFFFSFFTLHFMFEKVIITEENVKQEFPCLNSYFYYYFLNLGLNQCGRSMVSTVTHSSDERGLPSLTV